MVLLVLALEEESLEPSSLLWGGIASWYLLPCSFFEVISNTNAKAMFANDNYCAHHLARTRIDFCESYLCEEESGFS